MNTSRLRTLLLLLSLGHGAVGCATDEDPSDVQTGGGGKADGTEEVARVTSAIEIEATPPNTRVIQMNTDGRTISWTWQLMCKGDSAGILFHLYTGGAYFLDSKVLSPELTCGALADELLQTSVDAPISLILSDVDVVEIVRN